MLRTSWSLSDMPLCQILGAVLPMRKNTKDVRGFPQRSRMLPRQPYRPDLYFPLPSLPGAVERRVADAPVEGAAGENSSQVGSVAVGSSKTGPLAADVDLG